MKDKIGETLDLNPIDYEEIVPEDKQISTDVETTELSTTEKDYESDLKYVRGNIYDLIQQGTSSLDELMSLADQSQHPRAYEVIATLMKTLLDANKDLVELQEKRKMLMDSDTKQVQNINNNLIMSTQDVIKMLKAAETEENLTAKVIKEE